MTKPVFSIITPTFKRQELLKRNIKSVINQTFENYEHIIIDDANEEETAGMINSLNDSRIVLLHHENPRGAAASYNTGIRASKGEFILFLDDDDEYMPCFLKKMNERFLHSKPETGFIWTGISRIRDIESEEKILFSLTWPSHFETKEEGLVAATSIGNGFGVCIRRECLDSTGLYDESLTVSEDTDLLFRMAQRFDFETIPEVLVKIHQHGNSQLTHDNNYEARIKGKEIILNRYADFLKQNPLVYYTHYKAYADLCYKFRMRRRGRKAMFSIIWDTPLRILNFSDFFCYELSGKDTFNNSLGKKLINLRRFLKTYRFNSSGNEQPHGKIAGT
jgi:glycosyltransferase involved in cell wall biosynthesis